MLPIFIQAQTPKKIIKETDKAPKLIVGIVVDQMRADYISRYWSKYGNNGFKRLVNNGFYCKNTNYNYVPTYTGPGHASIFTGTTPSAHGIISNEWFSRTENKMIGCVADQNVITVGSESKEGLASPKNLLSTTIGDELRISTLKKSKVIGVSLKDRSAILSVGHSANAAYWFDEITANFISSSHYMNELPKWVFDFNDKKTAQQYLQQGWSTLLPIEQYTESLADENNYEKAPNKKEKPVFPYDYTANIEKKDFDIICSTPWGNTITKDFAIEAIKGEQLGKDEYTDMLCISFSSTDYVGHSYGPKSIEIEDVYLRLDKDIEQLLMSLDKEVGADNYVLFLTADHGACEVPAHLKDMKIPGGYINSKMAKELKAHLNSIYGDTLLLSYTNQQVFLNDATIASKKLDKVQIEKTCAEFFLKFDGVSETYTSESLRTQSYSEGSFRHLVQNGYNFKRSGDVSVCYLPGWMRYAEKGTTHGAEYSYDTHVPLIFYGAGIPKGSSVRSFNIVDIAPSACMLLNIPFPNACLGKPIEELFRK